jgi:hypothetical protein
MGGPFEWEIPNGDYKVDFRGGFSECDINWWSLYRFAIKTRLRRDSERNFIQSWNIYRRSCGINRYP